MRSSCSRSQGHSLRSRAVSACSATIASAVSGADKAAPGRLDGLAPVYFLVVPVFGTVVFGAVLGGVEVCGVGTGVLGTEGVFGAL